MLQSRRQGGGGERDVIGTIYAHFSAAAAAFFAPPLCFSTAFTIFCSSIRKARTTLNTTENTHDEQSQHLTLCMVM